jgi:hypothetical protein
MWFSAILTLTGGKAVAAMAVTGVEGIMEMLGLDFPDDFGFFEYFADLAESREDITFEALHEFFSLVLSKDLAELTKGYFDELLESIPEDQTEFYTLMEAVGMNMAGLAEKLACGDSSFDRDRGLMYYTEEFLKFRLWYLFDSKAVCRDTSDGTDAEMPVAEALVAHRLEKLGERAYSYDFSNCMDYPLEEYIFPV